MIKYSSGRPTKTGVYACLVSTSINGVLADAFLAWGREQQWTLTSGHRCTKKVFYWIGPLDRSNTMSCLNTTEKP